VRCGIGATSDSAQGKCVRRKTGFWRGKASGEYEEKSAVRLRRMAAGGRVYWAGWRVRCASVAARIEPSGDSDLHRASATFRWASH
jgi:hypothetical protein